MSADFRAMQALSDAGAQCGDCGDQPGDRICPDCERCYQEYVAALRAAGWVPREEVQRANADLIVAEQARQEAVERSRFGTLDHETVLQRTAVHAMADMLRRMAKAGAK
jgi:hypothetical protein